MSRGERESRHRPWILFLVFCCSSDVFVRWFCLYSCASGLRPLFELHHKIGLVTFVRLHIFVGWVQLSSLPRHVSQLTDFQNRVAPVLPSVVSEWRNIPFIRFHICAEYLWLLGFFVVIFNYRSHSSVTGWPITSALARRLRARVSVP